METTTSPKGTRVKFAMRLPLAVLPAIISGLFVHSAAAADLFLEGTFQGRNLYVQNPELGDGFGYCVKKVIVNGKAAPANISSGAFEIDFMWFQLQPGDAVTIVIEHQEGAKPVVLNPEVLLPRSTFIVTGILFDGQQTVTWNTEAETGSIPFTVEEFRWNKWITAGTVGGSGLPGTHIYRLNMTPHSGVNKIRVIQIDYSGMKRVSQEYTFDGGVASVEKSEEKVKDAIHFKANGTEVETQYEIYDTYGNRVMKGRNSTVPCSTLKKGIYYINFDNKTEKFLKV